MMIIQAGKMKMLFHKIFMIQILLRRTDLKRKDTTKAKRNLT